jgi:hypothetical protein
MQVPRILLLFGCLFLFSFVPVASETNQILFLHVKLKDGVVTLVDSKIRPGVLKPHRDGGPKKALRFSAEDSAGAELWSGSMEDPTVKRLETSDENTGELTVHPVDQAEAEFTVRMPAVAKMHHISFYRDEKIAAANAVKTQRKLLGKILATDLK